MKKLPDTELELMMIIWNADELITRMEIEEHMDKERKILSNSGGRRLKKVLGKYEAMQKIVQDANLRLEQLVLYDHLFSRMGNPEDLIWNYIDEKGYIQIGWGFDSDADAELAQADPDQYGAMKVMTDNPYNGEDFVNLMEELTETIVHRELQADLERMISDMEHAMDTHDVIYIQAIYYTLHDMDYFLFRYGPDEVGVYSIRDRSVVSEYYGVLNIYGNGKE